MKVQVMYLLATLRASITQQSKPALWVGPAPLLHRKTRRQNHHAPDERSMRVVQAGHGGNVQLWNHQKVYGRPGMYVMKGINVLILINQL